MKLWTQPRTIDKLAVASYNQIDSKFLAIGDCQLFDNYLSVADTAELIFITTPDDAIASAASEIR